MKLLHTADWHLGKKLEATGRIAEQRRALEEIVEICESEQPDAVLVAGDVFDTYSPPSEAVDLLNRTLVQLSGSGRRPVILIAGNHDSPDRLESQVPLAQELGIFIFGYPSTRFEQGPANADYHVTRSAPGFLELAHPNWEVPLRLVATPFLSETRMKQAVDLERPEASFREMVAELWAQTAQEFLDPGGLNVLVSHLMMLQPGGELPEESDKENSVLGYGQGDALPTDLVPEAFHYAALGHIHGYWRLCQKPCPVVYSGSPVQHGFREKTAKNVVVAEGTGENLEIRRISLNHSGYPLYQKRFESSGQALQWLEENPDCWVSVEVVTDSYLDSQEVLKIKDAHRGIVGPITPILSSETDEEAIDLGSVQRPADEVFEDYFQKVHGTAPTDALRNLFSEILERKRSNEAG